MAAVVLFSALSPAVTPRPMREIKELQRQADELQRRLTPQTNSPRQATGSGAKYINELNAQIEVAKSRLTPTGNIDIIDSQIKSIDNQIIETKRKLAKGSQKQSLRKR